MAGTSRSGSKVRSHPLVEALAPDPSKPPRPTIKLVGLPGPAPQSGSTRLWLDADLTSYVDVPDDAILYSKELPDEAGTVVWVAADATLTHGSVSSHETQASFLTGDITASHLAGVTTTVGRAQAAGELHGITALPSSVPSTCTWCPTHPPLCGPISAHVCPTHPPLCPPISVHVCPTHPPLCAPISAYPCPTVATCTPTQPPLCHPVSFDVCHTTTTPCLPTSPVVCNVTLTHPTVTLTPPCPIHTTPTVCLPSAECPSHSVICRSGVVCQAPSHDFPCHSGVVTIACPTPSAVGGCVSQLCPSVSIPCQSATVCPSGICPSAACGGQVGGGGGPVTQ